MFLRKEIEHHTKASTGTGRAAVLPVIPAKHPFRTARPWQWAPGDVVHIAGFLAANTTAQDPAAEGYLGTM